jgi:DNA-binding NarL/FixJ family response regulator
MNTERKAVVASTNGTLPTGYAGGDGVTRLVEMPVATDHASAFTRTSSSTAIPISTSRASWNRKDHPAEAVVRLTSRETDVLRLLARGLTYIQVSDRLGVSLNTATTHVKNIYSKLDVHSGRAAVWRALELRLLGASESTPSAVY